MTASSFDLSGSVSGSAVTSVSGGGSSWQCSVNGMSASGAVTIRVKAGAVLDVVGNTVRKRRAPEELH